MRLSVVIPTLNEEEQIAGAIQSIGQGSEIIVVDGGSRDATRDIASSLGARVKLSKRGRGLQMDAGALKASGEVLLFLHADTRLPKGWLGIVESALSDEGVVGGAFSLKIDSQRYIFRIIERMANIRSRFLGFIYGDQAIFVRREAFFESGCFKSLPLMEDIECVKSLRAIGKVVILDEPVLTSYRRWEGKPVIVTTFRNWIILVKYLLGVSPERLYLRYYKKQASGEHDDIQEYR